MIRDYQLYIKKSIISCKVTIAVCPIIWTPNNYRTKTPWPESANELNRSTYRGFSTKLVPTIADRPPLWPSGQEFLATQPEIRFDSRYYQICCEVVGLERGTLSLASTTDEVLGRKSSGSSLENRDYSRRRSAVLTTWLPLITIHYIYIYIIYIYIKLKLSL
jgi:hypothetical protein